MWLEQARTTVMFWFAVAALLEYEDSRSVDPCSNGKLTEQATVA
jgi:hypothetical protein